MVLGVLRSRVAAASFVGAVAATSMLGVSGVPQGPAVAAPRPRSLAPSVLPSVVPGSYDGDVRSLPKVPSGPSGAPELEEPTPARTSHGHPSAGSGAVAANMPATVQNFAGLHYAVSGAGFPPDPTGDVGPNNYIEAVNTSVGIFSKTGVQQAALTFNTLWAGAGTGTPCDTTNNGDPTVVYDRTANRWFVADFAWTNLASGPYYECIAVSKTGNPVTGGWWFYAIRADDAAHPWLADYPKMGIWPDGLYMTANMFDCLNSACSSSTYEGVRVYAFNRTAMESGLALQTVVFDPGSTYFTLLPSNMRGAAPPAGTPNYMISESSSVYAFEVFKFHVNWVTPGLSTFTGPTTVSQTSYTFSSARVPQPGTTTMLDTLEDRLMMQAQYRNISGSESLWVSHTVQAAPVGVQWAQINVTGGTVVTTPVQQQIWRNVNSDGVSRFMPSLAVDHQGNMAVGYSASSSSVFPSIRYAGRLATDPLNTLARGEAEMFAGTGSQAFNCGGAPCSRWGDYTSMSVDPVDDCTFWYVNEYYATTGSTDWQTRIGSFKYPSCVAPTAPGAPTGVLGTAGNRQVVLGWTAPSSDGGAAITNYRVSVYNGSGGSPSGVTGATTRSVGSAATAFTFSGLTNGTPYKFKVAAVNTAGTGTLSGLSATATPRTVPGAPGTPVTHAGSHQVALSWTAPSSNGGAAITDYAVQYRRVGSSTWQRFADGTSTTHSATVTGLVNGRNYAFHVAAKNTAGIGSYSPSATATPRTVPGAPGTPVTHIASHQVALSWTAPSSNGGAAITDYVVQYRQVGSSTWRTFADGTSTSRSVTVTGLVNGRNYAFHVAAKNTAGTGPYSPAATATPHT